MRIPRMDTETGPEVVGLPDRQPWFSEPRRSLQEPGPDGLFRKPMGFGAAARWPAAGTGKRINPRPLGWDEHGALRKRWPCRSSHICAPGRTNFCSLSISAPEKRCGGRYGLVRKITSEVAIFRALPVSTDAISPKTRSRKPRRDWHARCARSVGAPGQDIG